MPQCQNCGAVVTERYVRVLSPRGVENPRCCPRCPDKLRQGSTVRDTRSSRVNQRSRDHLKEST